MTVYLLHVHFAHCLVFQLKQCARFEVLTMVVLKIQVLCVRVLLGEKLWAFQSFIASISRESSSPGINDCLTV
jgi:hypothetical protein